MKKNITYILLLSLFIFACKKNELERYSATDNIYLYYLDREGRQDTSTITYSFAYNPSLSSDTIWVPVISTGNRVSHPRQFVLSVVDSTTTAAKGVHYEPLKPFYVMPADSGRFKVPVILKNTDDALSTKSVSLELRITAGGEFKADMPVPLRSKKIVFSSRLEKPGWWMYWQSSLGDYGRVKHQLFLISSGTIDLVDMSKPDSYLQIPRTLYYIDNTRAFMRDPAAWIARNPTKGYKLEKRNDITTDYDFFHESSPLKRFHFKYIAQVNGYFFMDENGKQIVL